MSLERDGIARSVQVRLARHAKKIGVDPNLVLTRYGVERFLYRLSRSTYVERFVLKGGMRRGPNSHVYSIEAAECLAIRADPGWHFESYDFSGWLRTSATCPAGTVGVYRAYNNRFAQNDSNHRYTIEIAVYNAMLALGWLGEGIVFCVVE